MPKVSPLVSGELQSAQEKQCMWNTRSRARITSSDAKIGVLHRAHRFDPYSLQIKFLSEFAASRYNLINNSSSLIKSTTFNSKKDAYYSLITIDKSAIFAF